MPQPGPAPPRPSTPPRPAPGPTKWPIYGRPPAGRGNDLALLNNSDCGWLAGWLSLATLLWSVLLGHATPRHATNVILMTFALMPDSSSIGVGVTLGSFGLARTGPGSPRRSPSLAEPEKGVAEGGGGRRGATQGAGWVCWDGALWEAVATDSSLSSNGSCPPQLPSSFIHISWNPIT